VEAASAVIQHVFNALAAMDRVKVFSLHFKEKRK
jgi:hypothetical protein